MTIIRLSDLNLHRLLRFGMCFQQVKSTILELGMVISERDKIHKIMAVHYAEQFKSIEDKFYETSRDNHTSERLTYNRKSKECCDSNQFLKGTR